ncbi:MAG: PorV/PorQ family protein [candidate division Zixibacteria bacterium]|nr:PorV/PorQ family protein [candidate division Zixibacteria bacterium]
MKRTICLLLSVLPLSMAWGQQTKVGSAGAQFLKIGVGSRYQAMGDAGSATVSDVYAMYWNPAGLVGVENNAVSFTNVNYLMDIELNYFAYAKNFEGVGVFGASATVLSMGKQDIYDFANQEGTGRQYSASSFAIGVSYARQLTSSFAFGGTARYIGERIHLEKSNGYALDFGTMLWTGFRTLRLGLAITNMGPQLEFSGPDLIVPYDEQYNQGTPNSIDASVKVSPYSLPMAFRMGVAYDVPVGPKSTVTLAADLRNPNDNVQQGSLGAEFAYNNQFFLRGGYRLNSAEEKMSVGAGLTTPVTRKSKLSIDYAWQDFGRLNSTQRFSVGFLF